MNTSRRLNRPVLPTRSRGVAVIEFAVLLVPMMLLILGTLELGRAVMSYQLMSRSVRDAARHVSEATGSNLPQLRDEARCIAYSGAYNTVVNAGQVVTACDGTPVAPGLALDQIVVCDWLREAAEPDVCTGMRIEDPTAGAIYLTSVGVRNYTYTGMFLGAFTNAVVRFGEISAVMRMSP